MSRADQDALAAESHRRAAAAAAAAYFTEQILPIEVPGKKGATVVAADEHVRPGVSLDDMARLRPAFAPDGTVPATRKVLDRTGIKLDEIDVFEVNEAFAAQPGPAGGL